MNILTIAESSLGYLHTYDSKLNMSNSKKGEKNTMYSKKQTKQTRDLISLTMKGQPGHMHTHTTRANISEPHIGKTISKQTKNKIATPLKGRIFTQETKAKLKIAMFNKNKNPSLETRTKMKLSHSKPILVTNIIHGETFIYPSIKQAALELNTTSTKIRTHIKNKSMIFDLYIITVLDKA